MGLITRFIAVFIIGFSCLMADVAEAHHQRKHLDTSGMIIPNLAHGQLRIMARYRAAILALADKQVSPGFAARTLQNYVNLQYAYCLWGLVPGSITNEDSPFNECSHAYLAASRALLDELSKVPTLRQDADALAEKINIEMLSDSSALQICSNSLQPFNTAQIMMPEWHNVPFNPIRLLLILISAVTPAFLFCLSRSSGKSLSRAPSPVGMKTG